MINLSKLKPSELIRLAIEDMKKSIASGASVNMGLWCTKLGTPHCTVCFAGAIMLQREKDTVLCNDGGLDLFDINKSKYKKQYMFLDRIRKGEISEAMKFYRRYIQPINKNLLIGFVNDYPDFAEYESCVNDEQFFSQMKKIADEFEELGL